MPVGSRINNPGNLTVTGPNSFLYAGQTGVYSANGLYYAQFGTAQAGADALTSYIQRHVNNGWNTLSRFTGGYLNGTPGSLGATSANPWPRNYLATLQGATGLGPNDPISSSLFDELAIGITKAEGTSGTFGASLFGGGNASGIPSVEGSIDSVLGNIGSWWGDFSKGLDILSGDAKTTDGKNLYEDIVGSAVGGIGAEIQKAFENLGRQLGPILFRSGFATIGLILIVIGLMAVVFSNKQVQQAAVTAAAVL